LRWPETRCRPVRPSYRVRGCVGWQHDGGGRVGRILSGRVQRESDADSAAYDEREYEREKALVANDFTPREVYDRTETDLKVARQHVASIEQQIAEPIQQGGATRVNLATSVFGSRPVTNR